MHLLLNRDCFCFQCIANEALKKTLLKILYLFIFLMTPHVSYHHFITCIFLLLLNLLDWPAFRTSSSLPLRINHFVATKDPDKVYDAHCDIVVTSFLVKTFSLKIPKLNTDRSLKINNKQTATTTTIKHRTQNIINKKHTKQICIRCRFIAKRFPLKRTVSLR